MHFHSFFAFHSKKRKSWENNGNSRCTLFPDLCTSNELVSCRSRMNERCKPNKRYLQVTNMSKVIRKYGEIWFLASWYEKGKKWYEECVRAFPDRDHFWACFFSLWQLSDWMHVREESWTASVEKLSRRLVSHDQSFQPTFQSSQNGAKSWGHRTTNVEDFYKNLLSSQEIRRSHELILSFRCLLGYVRKNLRLFRSCSNPLSLRIS